MIAIGKGRVGGFSYGSYDYKVGTMRKFLTFLQTKENGYTDFYTGLESTKMMVQKLGQIHLKINGKSMQHLHKRVIDLNKHNMILYKEHIMISQ